CVKNKFDVILFIEGARGIGKSTLGYKISLRLHSRGVVKFIPQTHLVYSREDTIKLLATKIRHVILSDELINVAYNRDFFEKEQKTLLKAINMYRDSENVLIGCIPKFEDLDIQMKRLCKIRISVIRRGVALIHIPLKGIFLPDPWDTQGNIKKELKKNKSYGKLSTVKGVLIFKDITEPQREIYEAIKKTRRGHVFDDKLLNNITNPDQVFFDRVYGMLTKGHLSKDGLESICRAQGKIISSFRDRLNKKLREDPDKKQTVQAYLDIAAKRYEKSSNGDSLSQSIEETRSTTTTG
ncbi:hypothetical protein LCGC14_2665970, partial [marine sediment metagenome]